MFIEREEPFIERFATCFHIVNAYLAIIRNNLREDKELNLTLNICNKLTVKFGCSREHRVLLFVSAGVKPKTSENILIAVP